MEKMCPDYFQAYKLTAGVYGETVFPDHVYDVFIKTSHSTYKYLQGLNDCYGTGPKGETIHYLRDPQSKYYKDRLFKFIFGNPENKEWTLSLYNAINGTTYSNPDEMPYDFLIKPFMMANRAEVKNMFLTEYNEEKVLEQERREGRLDMLIELAKEGKLSVEDASQ